MPRTVTVTLPDGVQHTYQNVPDDVTPEAVSARAQSEFGAVPVNIDGGRQAAQSRAVPEPQNTFNPNAPQPGIWDRVVGSPLGRFVGEAVVKPAASLVEMIDRQGGQQFIPNGSPVRAGYEGSLARNRNTPGYAAARQQADAITNSGLSDQLIAPLLPSMAGATGILGGFDSMNARADAQTAAQEKYASENPVSSLAAGLAGGFLGAPQLNPGGLARPFARQALSPTEAATEYVTRLMGSSKTAPTPDALRMAGQATSKPLTSAEVIGKPAEVALGALARREGKTPDVFQGLLLERGQSAPSRMLEDFAQAGGISPEAARGDIDALVAEGRQRAKPAYDVAYSQPAVMTDRLGQFAKEPLVQRGMKEGIKIERLKALAEGKIFDPKAYAITGWDEAGDPIIGAVPTWQSWDAAKIGLDNILDGYRDGVTKRLNLDKYGMAVDDVRKAMLRELDAANPAYGQARAVAGDYLSASEAFRNGGKFLLNGKMTEKQFSEALGRMTPAEKDAFLGGMANQAFDMAQNGKLNPKLFSAPRVQQKLAIAYGPEKARLLSKSLQEEMRMAQFASKRSPGAGSPIQEYGQAMADQDGNAALAQSAARFGEDLVRSRNLSSAVTNLALDKGKNLAARYLTRGMAIPVRDEAGRLLMSSPEDLANLLQQMPVRVPQRPMGLPRLTSRSAIPYGLFGAAANPALTSR